MNVLVYLRKEVDLYDRLHFLPTGWNRERLCLISLDEPHGVSWNWWIDPKGPAFDVLEEFKYFGASNEGGRWPDEKWASWDVENWPYSFAYWHQCIKWVELRLANTEMQRTSKIFNQRFQRRQCKKAAKLARAQGLIFKGPRIPGAWVD